MLIDIYCFQDTYTTDSGLCRVYTAVPIQYPGCYGQDVSIWKGLKGQEPKDPDQGAYKESVLHAKDKVISFLNTKPNNVEFKIHSGSELYEEG